MFGAASKGFFNLLARSRILNTRASRYGMRRPNSFARRFIAGETISEAIEAARRVEARGLTHTLDLLGESVTTLEQADAAARAYLKVVDAIVQSGIGRNLSLKLTQLGLDVDKAIATHDPKMIELTRTYANEHGVAPDRFEFQMLYGVRRDLQARLVRDGYRLRVYIPFGREWFPYFMRRLGERPANIGFVLRGILGETG